MGQESFAQEFSLADWGRILLLFLVGDDVIPEKERGRYRKIYNQITTAISQHLNKPPESSPGTPE